jgi:hypothetical protein
VQGKTDTAVVSESGGKPKNPMTMIMIPGEVRFVVDSEALLKSRKRS